MEENNTRTYELGFLLVPTLSDEEAAQAADVRSAIKSAGGTIVADGTPEYIDLAYRMEKNIGGKKLKWTQAYFGWFKFDTLPDNLEGLKKALDGNLNVIRYILVKTSIENMVVFKKPKGDPRRENPSDTLISDEELDALEAQEAPEEDSKAPHETLPSVEQDLVEDTVSE